MSSCSASITRRPERTASPTCNGWASRGRASPTTTVASPCRTACSVRRKRSSSGPTGSSRDGTSARATRKDQRGDRGRVPRGLRRLDLPLTAVRLVDGSGVARSGRRARGGPRARDRAPAKHRRAAAERADHDRGRRAARAGRARGSCRGMTIALFVVLLLAGTAAVIAPLARRPLAWPADPPDQRDDVARAVSSLRDLEFSRAAGTIAPADYVRLRASLERDAFVRRPPESRGKAPVRTLVAAALIAAIAVAVAVFYLPPSAGDRAPGETVTGTVPQTDALAALEARAGANPSDVPTQLAHADAYVQP